MDIEDANKGQKIPVAIHFIALFYIVQAIYIFYIFSTTRKYASLTLITVDIITLLLLLIPLVAIWSIYNPNRYLRWFPLYGILFNLVVIFGIGNFMLNIDWLTEVGEKSTSDAENFVSGMMTIFFSFVLTLWMVLPAIPLYSNESTRKYVLQQRPDIAGKTPVITTKSTLNKKLVVIASIVILAAIIFLVYAMMPGSVPYKTHLN